MQFAAACHSPHNTALSTVPTGVTNSSSLATHSFVSDPVQTTCLSPVGCNHRALANTTNTASTHSFVFGLGQTTCPSPVGGPHRALASTTNTAPHARPNLRLRTRGRPQHRLTKSPLACCRFCSAEPAPNTAILHLTSLHVLLVHFNSSLRPAELQCLHLAA